MLPIFLIGVASVVAAVLLSYLLIPVFGGGAQIAGEMFAVVAAVAAAANDEVEKVETLLRRALGQAWGNITIGHGQLPSASPIWDAVVSPLWWGSLFIYLALADLYTTAVTFVPLFGNTQDVPTSFHLPLLHSKVTPNFPLLIGLLWTAIAAAYGLGLYQTSLTVPRRPFDLISDRSRRIIRNGCVLGLIVLTSASVLFFLWRQGAIDAHARQKAPGFGQETKSPLNTLDGLRLWVVALLAGALTPAVALSAWAAESLIGLLVVAGLFILWLAALAFRALTQGVAKGFQVIAKIIEELLTLPRLAMERMLGLAEGATNQARERFGRRDRPPSFAETSAAIAGAEESRPLVERTGQRLYELARLVLMLPLTFFDYFARAANAIWRDVGRAIAWVASRGEMSVRGVVLRIDAIVLSVWRDARAILVWFAVNFRDLIRWLGENAVALAKWIGRGIAETLIVMRTILLSPRYIWAEFRESRLRKRERAALAAKGIPLGRG